MKSKIKYLMSLHGTKLNFDKESMTIVIPYPTKKSITHYLQFWETDEGLTMSESIVHQAFNRYAPTNIDLANVYMKTILLNKLYSTQVIDVFSLAKHIHEHQELDSLMCEGNVKALDVFNSVPLGRSKKMYNLYSFGSKYCSFHNPSAYPLYDKYVHALLCKINELENFSDFKSKDLDEKNYQRYKEILISFMDKFRIDKEEFAYKKLDKYLWQLGKDLFETKNELTK